MSQDVINILKSQLPLFEKMRRSAMLTYAMRGTATKTKLLKYVQEVELTTWQMIQLNEHTIREMEKELGVPNDTSTATSEVGSAATGSTEDRNAQIAAINEALRAGGEGAQLHSRGDAEVDPTAIGKA